MRGQEEGGGEERGLPNNYRLLGEKRGRVTKNNYRLGRESEGGGGGK